MQIKTITLTLVLLFSLQNATLAQELTIKSLTAAPMDLSASQYERKDLAGQPCGLVKVQLATTGAKFEGNIVGKTEYKTGEYWVYMENGSYMLTVKHPSFVPLDINFKDYGISGISSKTAYKLTLLMPESREKSTQQFNIRYSPKDAIVIIDSKPYQGQNGVVTASLPVGQHDYLVTASGYEPVDGSIRLKSTAPTTLRIDLEKSNANLINTPVQHFAIDNAVPMENIIETFTVNGVSFNMVRVKGGTFTMGTTPEQGSDAASDKKPAHQVMLSPYSIGEAKINKKSAHQVTLTSYSIGETEVTQALWNAVMGGYKGSNLPVMQISWNDCRKFIKKLNKLTKRNFRLPTEAEWEYAARGGNMSRGFKYSGSNDIDEVAWYTETTNDKGIKDVKTKKANELGIYDMSGNVYEWCQDWYDDYNRNSQTNPTGPISGSDRVVRGGSWYSADKCCYVSYRSCHSPDYHYDNIGLRLAL